MSRATNETPSVKSYNQSLGGRLHMNKANMQMHTNDDALSFCTYLPTLQSVAGRQPRQHELDGPGGLATTLFRPPTSLVIGDDIMP